MPARDALAGGPAVVVARRARWLTQTWQVIARGKTQARRADLASEAARHLAALQRDLSSLGLPSDLNATGVVWPWLRVRTRFETSPRVADFENSVVAVYIGGIWCLCWPWLELIRPAGDPAGAAAVIADHLGHEVPLRDIVPGGHGPRGTPPPGALVAGEAAVASAPVAGSGPPAGAGIDASTGPMPRPESIGRTRRVGDSGVPGMRTPPGAARQA